jgi:peptidoglycan/LPS O-acetylase OafA/YrhL
MISLMKTLSNMGSQQTLTIGEALSGRDNNFNLLRFFAATMVIWSHSFALRSTSVATDPLGGILGFGWAGIAVNVFFAISGFLIVRSYLRHDSLRIYVQARALRIMPGLIVAVLFCALVIGPLFTTLSAQQYFSHDSVWKFIHSNITMFNRHPTLPGVFTGNPRLGVNGSLWTLSYEVFMYFIVAVTGITGLLKKRNGIALICFAYLVYLIFVVSHPELAKEWLTPRTPKYLRLSLYFFLGACLYIFRSKVPLSPLIIIGLWIFTATAYKASLFNHLFAVSLTYTTFWLALVPKGWILKFNSYDDYSYGIYIYAFPVQQMLVATVTDIGVLQLFWSAFAVTLVCAWISCKLVEKPALRLNSKLTRNYYMKREEQQ